MLSLIAIASLVFAVWNRGTATPKEVVRFSITLPPGEEITDAPAISPDGQTIAYVSQKGMGESQLYVRDLSSFESRLVAESSGAEQPFFSPDGRRVAYYAKGKLQKSEVAGGNPIILCNTASLIGATWCEDHTIIYSTGVSSGLLRIPDDGGKPESLTEVNEADLGYAHVWPQSLPGSHDILFTIWGGVSGGNALLSIDSLSWQTVKPNKIGIFAASSGSTGYLLSLDYNGGIRATPFDPTQPGLK